MNWPPDYALDRENQQWKVPIFITEPIWSRDISVSDKYPSRRVEITRATFQVVMDTKWDSVAYQLLLEDILAGNLT